MEVVGEVLVVGVGVHRLDVPADDAEAVVHHLERRHDRVGRAACGGQHGVVFGEGVVVDAVDDVLHLALPGGGEHGA